MIPVLAAVLLGLLVMIIPLFFYANLFNVSNTHDQISRNFIEQVCRRLDALKICGTNERDLVLFPFSLFGAGLIVMIGLTVAAMIYIITQKSWE